ncbi:MAG TPA: hypothetical protein DD619_03195 [Alphaproteobacteria bacterium]|nr:hypothetical protein [Alphaproteobacteria bacterium]
MLCNWHFDIFWPDHWRQAYALWKAGWVIRAPKEWAFVIILVTFFPMLITGWWTLCMVAWERIIYDIITSPLALYRRLIKTPLNVMKTNNKYGVVKRKSYKQIRPAGVGFRMPISDYSDNKSAAPVTAGVGGSAVLPSQVRPAAAPAAAAAAKTAKKTDIPSAIDHALFKFDDDDDDFDLDIDSFEKADILKKKEPAKAKKPVFDDEDDEEDNIPPRKNKDNNAKRTAKKPIFDDDEEEEDEDFQPRSNSRRNKNERSSDNSGKDQRQKNKQNRDDARSDKPNRNNKQNNSGSDDDSGESSAPRSPVYDSLQQKGYDVIAGVNVNNTLIDFVGVSDTEICLCLVDKENGDWLADEELFNGEEPLWFSENSHRISPVRKLDVARNIIRDKLAEEDFEQEIKSYVVVQMANIINADDMFEIWNKMDIEVTRINRGAPKEIHLFSKSLDEAEGQIDRKELNRLRKILKSIK